jgi:hypothetical protein
MSKTQPRTLASLAATVLTGWPPGAPRSVIPVTCPVP